MELNYSRIPRKAWIILLLGIISIVGYFYKSYLSSSALDSYTTFIEMEQIHEVLKMEEALELPNHWIVASIKKYDDGFTSPIVTIKYRNGVNLLLTRSKLDLTKEWNNREKITTVIESSNVTYGFIFPINLEDEVKWFIDTLH